MKKMAEEANPQAAETQTPTPVAPSATEIRALKRAVSAMLDRGQMESGSAATRLEAYKAKYPELSEKFPGLFMMCCKDFDGKEADKEREFTSRCVMFMLKKLEEGGRSSNGLHDASVSVGEMLYDEYVRPHVAQP